MSIEHHEVVITQQCIKAHPLYARVPFGIIKVDQTVYSIMRFSEDCASSCAASYILFTAAGIKVYDGRNKILHDFCLLLIHPNRLTTGYLPHCSFQSYLSPSTVRLKRTLNLWYSMRQSFHLDIRFRRHITASSLSTKILKSAGKN